MIEACFPVVKRVAVYDHAGIPGPKSREQIVPAAQTRELGETAWGMEIGRRYFEKSPASGIFARLMTRK